VAYPLGVTPAGGTTRPPQAAYPGVVHALPGIVSRVRSTRPVTRVAWRGLIHVLLGANPPPTRSWRSPWQRRIVYTALGVATLLLSAGNLASLANGAGKVGPCPGARVYESHVVHCLPSRSLLDLLGGLPNLWAVVAVGVVVPLALAVRYPLLGWRIGWLGLLLLPLPGLSWWGGLPWGLAQILVLLVLLCAAGIRHDRAVLGWLWALTLVPWWFWIVRQGPGMVTATLGSVAFLAMAVAVDGAGTWRRAQRALADQAEQAELDRARWAVLEERTRIARELHDVVAHHMSLMAIRAESAPHRLGALPDPVRAEFGWLSASAREALADMRRLLGVLRSDQPAARAPQPGLHDLPGLVDAARQAGMAVELSAPPDLDRVPFSAGVCAYRIVQEALSNAGRHAAGAAVAVSVHHTGRTVTLHVTNGPGDPTGPRVNGHRPGHGLAGMRERVELLGGSLSAGPAPDGGFAVSAVLPLTGSAA
jgi:signal transduction histidine kinase